ncbi:metal ABC transporter substrate-binding protein [Numidum massiliense]|uniref:metal ABC transporter substrate-binding protein n=1 Tax=Numidum massiliense TaxID=1522315 RepID=UPI0006D5A922|nr:metal ABC transporter substrate-binding protein [Numidum massiliense]
MKRFKLLQVVCIALIAVLALSACSSDSATGDASSKNGEKATTDAKNSDSKDDKKSNDKVQVVTTFSILQDIVKNVGGDRVDIHSMVPIGTDPHEYSPLPEDIQKSTDADVMFWNGLDMETEGGWFENLVESAGKTMDGDQVFELNEGVEPMYLSSDDGKEKEINPHSFLSAEVGIKMTENARDALKKVDPDHADVYDENAKVYIAELEKIHQQYKERIAEIPEERRVLVTSERAYQYMAAAYGLEEGYIWEIDTEEQGTPEQITSLVKFIKEKKVPALFVESNVEPRPMETVSKEAGVDIASKLFSDETGKPGEDGDTYLKMLQWNIDKIYDGLKK